MGTFCQTFAFILSGPMCDKARVTHLSLGTDVFLNRLIVMETSRSRSQPRRLSGFLGAA